MRMLLAGGGTGGHLFPAVAIAEKLLAEEAGSEVLFVGTSRGIEAREIPKLGYNLEVVDISGFAGRSWLAKVGVMIKLAKSINQGRTIIERFQPDVVVGVGGYASAPLVMAARMKGVPVVLHEQNAIPGLTNRMLGRWADKVCVSFEETALLFSNAEVTGNPLRSGLEECAEGTGETQCLLVFGGSRGARAINERICEALVMLGQWKGKLDIVHQTGTEDFETVQKTYRNAGWENARVTPFIDDMASVYERADLVVCRAGATTVAELTACGRPAILIPFPQAAGDHQKANARALAEKGAAILLDQDEASPERLATLIRNLLENPQDLKSMARIARSLSRRGAATRILDLCRQVSGVKKAA